MTTTLRYQAIYWKQNQLIAHVGVQNLHFQSLPQQVICISSFGFIWQNFAVFSVCLCFMQSLAVGLEHRTFTECNSVLCFVNLTGLLGKCEVTLVSLVVLCFLSEIVLAIVFQKVEQSSSTYLNL